MRYLLALVFSLALSTLPVAAQSSLDGWLSSFRARVATQWKAPTNQQKPVVLEVRINRAGLIRGLSLTTSSGDTEVDKAAADAVRSAVPFNPLPEESEVLQAQVELTLAPGATPAATVQPRNVFLGVETRRIPAQDGKPEKVYVSGATCPSAEQAKLRPNDRIVALAGQPVKAGSDIRTILVTHKPHETITVRIERNDAEFDLPLQLCGVEVHLPVLQPEPIPAKLTKLEALPPSNLLKAEQVFGWGNVLGADLQQGTLAVVVGAQPGEEVLKAASTKLFEQVRSGDVRNLQVQVETADSERAWQAKTDGTAIAITRHPPDWQSAPLRLKAGTVLPVRLDIQNIKDIRQGDTIAVTGKILDDVLDRNGVPLVRSGTVVAGKMVTTPPFGHRLVLETIGKAKTPISAESEVLPAREVLLDRSGSVKAAFASLLYGGQVVGVSIKQPLSFQPDPPERVLKLPAPAEDVGAAVAQPTAKRGLELYNEGVAAASRQDWNKAIDTFKLSLANFPSRNAREALGWSYERRAEKLLNLDNVPPAIGDLERAVHLQAKVSNSLLLLASAYQALIDEAGASIGEDQLAYYRHHATIYGLALPDYSNRLVGLFAQEPAPAPAQGADYLDNVLYLFGKSGTATRQVTVRFDRQPIKVYIAAAPSPEYDEATWRAVKTWEELSDGTVRFERVNQSTDADITVVYSYFLLRGIAGYTDYALSSFDPRAFGSRMAAPLVNINLYYPLRLRPEGRLKLFGAVAAHEFGHALGMYGHSDSIDDLMYPSVHGATGPSARDIATLKKLYERRVDITRP